MRLFEPPFSLSNSTQVSRFWPLPPAACYQARLWIAQGNLAAASRWAQASGLNQADHPGHLSLMKSSI